MDTRALGGEFLPRGEILTVEMKTVTQYTALIRLTAQMRERERIPDPESKKARKRQLRIALRYRSHVWRLCEWGLERVGGHISPGAYLS